MKSEIIKKIIIFDDIIKIIQKIIFFENIFAV